MRAMPVVAFFSGLAVDFPTGRGGRQGRGLRAGGRLKTEVLHRQRPPLADAVGAFGWSCYFHLFRHNGMTGISAYRLQTTPPVQCGTESQDQQREHEKRHVGL